MSDLSFSLIRRSQRRLARALRERLIFVQITAQVALFAMKF
jgi:hypothetical protein